MLFGLGTAILLAATGKSPVERVSPPPWYRTILIGSCCAAALFSIGWSALRVDAWAVALLGGAACAMADRRTMLSRVSRNLHRALALAAILAAAKGLVPQPIVGLAALTGAGLGLLVPVDLLNRWPRLWRGSARSNSGGYRNEVLAIAAFLDSSDIPKSLVMEAAHEAGAGRASSLRTLAAGALIDVGPDSWQARPMVQDFARKRMLPEERKAWAARAVRALTLHFPRDPKTRAELCERLVPHALAAVGYAEVLDVERGPAAVLLDRVATYLTAVGRVEEAQAARERAIAHASAGFGEASAEVATLHSHLVQGRSAVAAQSSPAGSNSPGSSPQESSSRKTSSSKPLSAATREPSRAPVSIDLSNLSMDDGYSGRSALAFSFAQTGDVRLEAGDVTGARRDYRAALNNARFSLPRNHPLVTQVRARLAALPQPARDEDNEKRLVLGCFSLVVATVLICVGFTVVRDLNESRSKASDQELTNVDQLVEVCNSNQRYFPDAAAFAGIEPHPAQVFRRANNDAAFRRETFGGDGDPKKNQLVACALQTRTGPPVATCQSTTQPEIPLHEATYQVTIYETWTGRRLGSSTLIVGKGVCPTSYVPPPPGKPWMLYAAPSDDQYRQALQPILDLLPAAAAASTSPH
jgi:hypothetical protein